MESLLKLRSSQQKIGQVLAIFFIQTNSTISFAVFYSGLSLYLTKSHEFPKELATLLTGLFLSLHYSLPLIGGLIVNRIISYKNLYLAGSTIAIFGCLVLAYTQHLYLGLAIYLMYSLVTNVCLNMFVTQLFNPDQVKERRLAFSWKYIGMNLGFMLGFLLSGFANVINNYTHLFILMSVFLAIANLLALIIIKEPKLDKNHVTQSKPQQLLVILFLFAVIILIITNLLRNVENIYQYITVFSLGGLLLIAQQSITKTSGLERKNMLQFVAFSLASIIFWWCYMLTPVVIMQIIETHVTKTFMNFTLAPQWFMNINSILILTVVPIFTMQANKKFAGKLYSLTNASYFVIGFSFAILALISLSFGFHHLNVDSKIPLLNILGYLIFMTFAEIMIAPAGFALIGELINESQRGLMTACWSMNLAIGGLLASAFSKHYLLPYIGKEMLNRVDITNLIYSILFLICLLVITLILLLISRKENITIKEQETIRA